MELLTDLWRGLGITVKDIFQIAGITIATVSLLITAFNTRRTKRVTTASFWLDLREFFAKFNDIHEALCPDGVWDVDPERDRQGSPSSTSEWRRLDAYMGLLEHCSIMLERRLIDWKTFKSIYSYRVKNIVANPYIVQAKLIDEADDWQDFLRLAKKL